MPFLAAAAPYIAAGMSALSGIMSTNASLAQADSQATAARTNAINLEGQAATASAQGNAAEEAQRRRAAMVLGEARASGAEAGIASSGTFGGAYDQSAYQAELDALNIRYEGQNRRAGLLSEAGQQRYQSKAIRSSMGAIRMGGYLGAGASALMSYSAMGGKFGAAKTTSTSSGWVGPRD